MSAIDTVRRMGGFLATALGEGWVVDATSANQDPDGVNLRGPHLQHLHLVADRDRVVINGRFPQGSHRHGDVPPQRITVALDKGPERTAAEIRRRLLPRYEVQLSLVLDRNARHEMAVHKRLALATELAAILGEWPIEDERGNRTIIRYRARNTPEGDIGVRCEVALNNEATEGTIKISNATPDQIRAVLAAIGLPLQRQ